MNLEIAGAILDLLDELESRISCVEDASPNWARHEWGPKMRAARKLVEDAKSEALKVIL